MRLQMRNWMRGGLAALLAAVCTPAVAWAEDQPFREPGITYAPAGDAYIQWIAAALIIVSCLLIAVKNPHRSHLD